jgi:hypothetical protein
VRYPLPIDQGTIELSDFDVRSADPWVLLKDDDFNYGSIATRTVVGGTEMSKQAETAHSSDLVPEGYAPTFRRLGKHGPMSALGH